ncbi:hypothetical protein PI124_g9416 [Phytophthora idaei]|nr:hypothetical protein PI125_g9191 [Phytophthora idaei]KAG3245832.1 hypothetical protein PI124_g9416 [Phytophthora idaei]
MAAELRRLKAAEWLVIKCLSTLLDPVAKTIEELGGQNYPTISLVLPALSGIRKWLSRGDLFSSHGAAAGDESYVEETILMMDECRKILLELFNKQFAVIKKGKLSWIVFLDPRVAKRMPHFKPADVPRACDDVVCAAV